MIVNNTKRSRFETEINGEFAYLAYFYDHGEMELNHTFVPESDRGHGTGFALAKFALEYAVEHKLKLFVYCPMVTKYLEEHPEYEKLIDIRYEA